MRLLFTVHQCSECSSRREGESSLLSGLRAEMHGAERQRNAKHKAQAQPSTMKHGEVKCDTIPERVTLKKEIGLLSACTIIIGELKSICQSFTLLWNGKLFSYFRHYYYYYIIKKKKVSLKGYLTTL